MASLSRRGPGCSGVDEDEGTAESVKLKPEGVNDVEDKVFFSKLPA
jgi:hypothetical protein